MANPTSELTFLGPAAATTPARGTRLVRPFRAHFSDAELTEMRRRIAATRWPERETVTDETQGVPLAELQELARYWGSEYDWRKCETKLNELPQFLTEVDALDIHFIHVRSKHENALPLIVTHGWPGSVLEQLKIIERLTNPTGHGASATDAFHVVLPSLPGYGFSGKPRSTGWGPDRIAMAWVELMKRLGYEKFVAQGGDWGSVVVDVMAKQAPPELLGIHTNLPAAVPADVMRAIQIQGPLPADLSNEERNQSEKIREFFAKGLGYAIEMATRPQTLCGLADSPIALAAWLLDAPRSGAPGAPTPMSAAIRKRSDEHPATELTCDDVLDTITLFWLTNTGISSSRLYWENTSPFFQASGVTIPVAVSAFPNEIFQAPRSWAERAYPKLIHYNQPEKGGHFAAWEQPELFAAELRAGFRSLR